MWPHFQLYFCLPCLLIREIPQEPNKARQRYKITTVVIPVVTGRQLNVHKTFRRRPGRLMNVLCTFNLRPVSTGMWLVSGVSLNAILSKVNEWLINIYYILYSTNINFPLALMNRFNSFSPVTRYQRDICLKYRYDAELLLMIL